MALYDLFRLGANLDQELTKVFQQLQDFSVSTSHLDDNEASVTYTLALPGVAKENLSVDIDDENTLVVKVNEKGRSETFRRHLYSGLDLEHATVTYRDGLLTVSFPRLSRRRTLTITN